MSSDGEKETLLKASTEQSGAYGADTGQGQMESPGGPGEGDDDSQKKHMASVTGKRERLQRNPSLEKVDEDLDRERREEKKGFGCSHDYFGVKSYLHHFYDRHNFKDPDLYEDEDDFRYLLHPNPRRRRCTAIWWKVFVWIGANFLVFGIIGVLVGYLVPQRPIIVGSEADNLEIIDREAMSFNFNLDVCKLVGLILFCIGGLTLTVALLFPSFLYSYCDDDRKDDSFKVRMSGEDEPPSSPLEASIPYSSKMAEVQPDRNAEESVVTQEGMVTMKE